MNIVGGTQPAATVTRVQLAVWSRVSSQTFACDSRKKLEHYGPASVLRFLPPLTVTNIPPVEGVQSEWGEKLTNRTPGVENEYHWQRLKEIHFEGGGDFNVRTSSRFTVRKKQMTYADPRFIVSTDAKNLTCRSIILSRNRPELIACILLISWQLSEL